MDRQARVRRLYPDGTALVLCTGDCAMECHQCGGCRRERESIIAWNPDGAQPGELVLVHEDPVRLFLTALMLIFLPIGGFFAGYWVGAVLCGAGKWIGCLALAVGLGTGLTLDRKMTSKHGSGYTLIRYPQNIDKGDNGFD